MPIDRWMDKEDVVHIYNGILLSHRKNEMAPLAATRMDLEIIVLSEVSQRMTNIIWYHLYVESKKRYNWTDFENRLTVVENKFMATKEEGERRGIN